jgi:Mn-dependent DtxR family transcriptional regulator
MLSATSEIYLRAIYELNKKKGRARPKDLTEMLDVSSASVTEMLQKLARKKLINYQKRGDVTLTEDGDELASVIWARHDTFRRLLELAGVPPRTAYIESARIKHNLSEPSVTKLLSLVDRLEKCEDGKCNNGKPK